MSHDLVSWVQEHASVVKVGEPLKAGDLVTVTQGPFRGIEAIFKTYDGEKRAIVLLNLLAKITEAKFSLGLIKKAH